MMTSRPPLRFAVRTWWHAPDSAVSVFGRLWFSMFTFVLGGGWISDLRGGPA